ncbi:MAG: HEPN domain-containing protein [Deltaproteobacteria bacterium]|nr:HEPN domain-containing protein [Deltaproteobacteria bacterium]
MPTIYELKELANIRLEEVKSLFASELYDGAWYLTGYVVEMALKACICRTLDLDEYPEEGELSRSFKTHRLDILLTLSGLGRKLSQDANNNLRLLENWSGITEWNESIRYSPVGTIQKEQVEKIISSLEDEDGVFTWIKKHW